MGRKEGGGGGRRCFFFGSISAVTVTSKFESCFEPAQHMFTNKMDRLMKMADQTKQWKHASLHKPNCNL